MVKSLVLALSIAASRAEIALNDYYVEGDGREIFKRFVNLALKKLSQRNWMHLIAPVRRGRGSSSKIQRHRQPHELRMEVLRASNDPRVSSPEKFYIIKERYKGCVRDA